MPTRSTDPDFADRPKPAAVDRTPRFLGMRPPFAAVATPLLLTAALAAMALDPEALPSTSTRPRPAPALLRLVPGPVAPTSPSPLTSIDPRMIVAARAEVDEAMIHRARPDVDPRMIVPAPPSRPAQGIAPAR